MKQPRQGIRSTRHCQQDEGPPMLQVRPGIDNNTISINNDIVNDSADKIPFVRPATNANVIQSDDDSIANVFIFAVFADKRTGILYSDLTSTFTFMSLEGNVCFLVVYHYKSNAILALPIANFADGTILAAYQQQFELLKSKGHKIKVNVMDDQASKVIKKYLTVHNNVKTSLSNSTTTGRTQLSMPSRCSRQASLVPLQPRTATSHCNCGIGSLLKWRPHLTCCGPLALPPQCWCIQLMWLSG